MIRLFQQDTRLMKWLFAIIIGFAAVTMVITLVPGIFDNASGSDATVYATVREPGYLGRIFGESTPIRTTEVNQMAARQLQQQRLPESLLPYLVPRAGQILVQRAILQHEADRMNLQVSDEDLRRELRTGPFAQYIFPNGNYIGDDAYIDFVSRAFGNQLSRAEFEKQVKSDMELNRLQALITGGVTVSDKAVRDAYKTDGTKVKFDYVVLSADDVRKGINPSDVDLETFFKTNANRYATAVPEMRKIQYVAFDASNLPGGKPQVSDAEIQSYYNAHKDQYSVKEQVKTRHILISVPAGADAKTDAAAKTKAEDLLKQIKGGANFAELASKNSDDPGSKTQGGELPMYPTSGLDPAYAKAAMALNPGQTSDLVKSQFGYHIIQTEQKEPAHTRPLAEVKAEIVPVLEQQKAGAAEQAFATALAADAKRNGLEKAATAKGLHAVTTDFVGKDGVIGGLADGSSLLTQAFGVAKGADPAPVSTGEGYAIFQVADIKPAHAPDFATYKSHILEDYREQQVPQLLNTQLNRLEDRAKVLNDLKKAAAEMNLSLKTSDLVGKDGQVPDVGAMTGPASVAFTLAKGAISGPINTGRSGIVLSVVDKQEPTAEEITKNFDATREGLLSQQREEIFRVYLGELTQKYEKGGAVRYSKAQPAPGASPFGN
ncbi:MAG TPA: peptidyl-prolyl cis-trans isomerase [Edaphobacter sp.]|jgi:peptidyl-prolyl cis-trans isomerase D|nr:peptidyl-prolyl cis-trans isomerase [Edaphobacter sp.]